NLPQAAITTLDLVVPSRATNAQVIGSGPIRIEATEDNRSRLRSDALGVLTQLDLRWQKEGTEGPGRQVIVQAETQATIDESALESESRVRIEVAEGSLDQLTFGLAGEITRVQVDSEGTNDPVDFRFEPGAGRLVIKPSKPLAPGGPALELRVRTQQPFPDKSGKAVEVGRLELLDVPRKRQTGTIAILASGDRRFRFQPVEAFRIDPREVSSGGRAPLYAARYWSQPAKVEVLLEPRATLASQVAVKPAYHLTFTGKQIHGAFVWELMPRNRTAFQEIDLHWPSGFVLDRGSLLSSLVESVQVVEGSPETVRVRLTSRQSGPFSLKAEGVLTLGEGEIHSLPLPFVARLATEREGRAENLQMLPERGELRLTCQATEVRILSAKLPLFSQNGEPLVLPLPCGAGQVLLLRHPEAGQAELEAAIQPLRHQVRSWADVCIMSNAWELEQRLVYRFVGPAPSELALRVPRAIQEQVRATLRYTKRSGERVQVETALTDRGPRPLVPTDLVERLLPLPQDVGQDCEIVLAAVLPLKDNTDRLSVRLAAPGSQERLLGPAMVRVWTSAALAARPSVESGSWTVADGPYTEPGSAPDWQLRAADAASPLILDLSPAQDLHRATLVVQEARIAVSAPQAGRSRVRFAFRLDPLKRERIQLRLPLERTEIRLERLLVNGTEQRPETIRDSRDFAGMSEIDIPMSPGFLRGPVLVELEMPWPAGIRPLGFALQPLPAVEVADADAVHDALWSLEVPVGYLPLPWSGWADHVPSWGFRFGLIPPSPRANSRNGNGSLARFAGVAYDFHQRGTLDPPTILVVPKTLWTFLLSAVVFVVAVTLFYLPRPLALALTLLVVTAGLTMFFWKYPLWLGVVYGIQPGLAISAVILGWAWLRRRRWRRKVAYLPGFTRSSTATALTRSSVNRPAAGAISAGAVSSSNGSTRITPRT
ncbi:MAG: hypothetical protein NZM31_04225, partial [Gemmatales bacterium]|nr:hypothetical protein [Gemmatales bacterium]MDW8386207.1 hypothetical protein [Gemmatales bacterium]